MPVEIDVNWSYDDWRETTYFPIGRTAGYTEGFCMIHDQKDAPWFFAVVEGDLKSESLVGQLGVYGQRNLLGEVLHEAMLEAMEVENAFERLAPAYVSAVDEEEIDGELYETDSGLLVCEDLCVRDAEEGRVFIPPTGIVASGYQSEGVDAAALMEGFARKLHSGYWTAEVAVSIERWEPLFRELLSTLPSLDSIVVMLLDHYDVNEPLTEDVLTENTSRCFYKEVNSPPSDVHSLFDGLQADVLDNGHVDFGVTCEDMECTLWLTEHKTLQLATAKPDLGAKLTEVLASHLPEQAELPTFGNLISHFHYRPVASKSAPELAQWLLTNEWTEDEVDRG